MPSKMVLQPKVWRIAPQEEALVQEFARSLPLSLTVCRILLARGISSVPEAQRFLNPDLDMLHDPWLLDGMHAAVSRVRAGLEQGEKIMVHGDYDVDGVTSAALLVRVLRILRADVSWYVPHRQREGYDIGPCAVEAARERGVGLIVTTDCGSCAMDAVELAQSYGIDVIVTDHHEVGPEISKPLAMINPRKPGCPYPFKELAGVGVAFKFGEALVEACGYDVSAFRRRFCDLAAVGTVGDVVPLLDENRAIVKAGMEELPRTGKKGLQALMRVAGLSGRTITSQSLAWVLAPRLNAAGRLDDAAVALDLLLTNDDQEAERLAQKLEMQNRERQAEQERITAEALEQMARGEADEESMVLVLSSKGWHPGVVGVVASRITDRYNRPAILIALDESGQAGVGSARSIESFDLFEALMQCRHLLERCGGHAHAAGLSIMADNLQEFNSEINRIACEVLSEADLRPQLDVDAELRLDAVTKDLASELRLLEPHGHGNPVPVFMSRNVPVLQKTTMGANGSHLKLKLDTGSRTSLECVAFGWGNFEGAFRAGTLIDLCYNIRTNHYSGTETVQALLCDARAADAFMGEPFPTGRSG